MYLISHRIGAKRPVRRGINVQCVDDTRNPGEKGEYNADDKVEATPAGMEEDGHGRQEEGQDDREDESVVQAD
jgi:hypothetical protein